jgi:predicted Zn-dependent peptidase
VTTVSVWILAGSRHEVLPGTAHLLEHVVMQCVPVGRAQRVVDEIESWGGDANAVTTRDHVALYARVPTADAAAALRVLTAAATTTDYDDELIDGERRVVQEELRLAAADPTDIVHDVFFSAAYGAHPIGRPVGGTAAGAAHVGGAELTAWSRRYVRPELLGVVVSGGLTLDEVTAVLADSPLAALDGPAGGRPADSAPPIGSARRDLALASDTAAVVIGGPGFALDDRRMLAADIVTELLAGGNASVLNEEIRSRRGLSYDISGGTTGYRDTGCWRVAISTAPEQCGQVVELASELLTTAMSRGWPAGEVATARRRVAGLMRLEAESSLDEALLYGNYGYVGDTGTWSLPAHIAALAAVTTDEVNEAAQLMADQFVVATAGGT